MADRTRERRWIVLGTDGRHTTLGRHSDPTEAEIEEVERLLTAQGMAGWLAVAEGDYWCGRADMAVMEVRPLAHPTENFQAAVTAFMERRRSALATVGTLPGRSSGR